MCSDDDVVVVVVVGKEICSAGSVVECARGLTHRISEKWRDLAD